MMTIYELRSVQGTWVSGMATFLVTLLLVIVTYVMYNKQTDLMKQNLKVELYKQRYDIYKKLEKILKVLLYDSRNQPKNIAFDELSEIRDEVYLLFDKEIHDYLVLITQKAENLISYNEKEKDDLYFELISWFIKQFEDKKIRDKFKPYLDLSNYGLSKD